jgi:hypothetical protein
MRLFVFILGICVGIVGIGNRAEAQNYPWRAYYGGDGGGTNCGFATYEQCMETAYGLGGLCQPLAGGTLESKCLGVLRSLLKVRAQIANCHERSGDVVVSTCRRGVPETFSRMRVRERRTQGASTKA